LLPSKLESHGVDSGEKLHSAGQCCIRMHEGAFFVCPHNNGQRISPEQFDEDLEKKEHVRGREGGEAMITR
jgi:hypothetical protein